MRSMLTWMEITLAGLALAGLAAFAAGAVNALAGGGTLLTFPTLLAIGLPDIAANITNTVALCPGYLGGAFAQRKDLSGQGRRLRLFIPIGIIGGIAGGVLLIFVSGSAFRVIVPFLILLASLMLAVQDHVRDRIVHNAGRQQPGNDGTGKAILPVCLTSVYCGYFGAGQSVTLLSVFGIFVKDTLTRLNALKQCITFSSNVAAAVFFLSSGIVVWPVAAVMAVASLAGSAAGGRLAGRIDPSALRWTVVAIGIIVGIFLFLRL